VEAAAAVATTIAITTGGNLEQARAIAILVGPTETRANAIARSGTRSRVTFSCHEGAIANWFTIETRGSIIAAEAIGDAFRVKRPSNETISTRSWAP
jgi:hypothetical protein